MSPFQIAVKVLSIASTPLFGLFLIGGSLPFASAKVKIYEYIRTIFVYKQPTKIMWLHVTSHRAHWWPCSGVLASSPSSVLEIKFLSRPGTNRFLSTKPAISLLKTGTHQMLWRHFQRWPTLIEVSLHRKNSILPSRVWNKYKEFKI